MFVHVVAADSCVRRFQVNVNHVCYSADFFFFFFLIIRVSLLYFVVNVHGSEFLQYIVGLVSVLDLTVLPAVFAWLRRICYLVWILSRRLAGRLIKGLI